MPIALDRLEANLAILEQQKKGESQPLKNEPPKVIFSTVPAIVVLVDGDPVWRPVEKTGIERVINTSSIVLKDKTGTLYLHLFDGWLQAAALPGPWTVSSNLPQSLSAAYKTILDTKSGDPLTGGVPDDPDAKHVKQPTLKTGPVPEHLRPALRPVVPAPPGPRGPGRSCRSGYGGWHGGWYGAAWGVHGGAVWGPGYARWSSGNVYHSWNGTSGVSRSGGGYNAWTGNAWHGQSGAAYNSKTGTLAAGQRGSVSNVYTGNYASGGRGVATNTNTGATVAARGGTVGNAYTGNSVSGGQAKVYNPNTGNTTKVGGVTTSNGGGAARACETAVGKTSSGDYYAAKDGNVYKNTGDGWQQNSGSGWSNVNDQAKTSQLSKESSARKSALRQLPVQRRRLENPEQMELRRQPQRREPTDVAPERRRAPALAMRSRQASLARFTPKLPLPSPPIEGRAPLTPTLSRRERG